MIKIAGIRLLTGEIIYTDPLDADTDGDGLKDGEEINEDRDEYGKKHLMDRNCRKKRIFGI